MSREDSCGQPEGPGAPGVRVPSGTRRQWRRQWRSAGLHRDTPSRCSSPDTGRSPIASALPVSTTSESAAAPPCFRDARRHVRQGSADYGGVLESVNTRPFPFLMSSVGRRIIEPLWLSRLRGARVVAISGSTAAGLTARGIRAATAVPPGCDFPTWPSLRPRTEPRTTPRLAYVGRLVRTKLLGHALEAFLQICRVFPDATLDSSAMAICAPPRTGAASPGSACMGGSPTTPRRWSGALT